MYHRAYQQVFHLVCIIPYNHENIKCAVWQCVKCSLNQKGIFMATRYIHFTEEQKQAARQIDIAGLLHSQGETLKRSGSEYEWRDGSAKVTVRGNLRYPGSVSASILRRGRPRRPLRIPLSKRWTCTVNSSAKGNGEVYRQGVSAPFCEWVFGGIRCSPSPHLTPSFTSCTSRKKDILTACMG